MRRTDLIAALLFGLSMPASAENAPADKISTIMIRPPSSADVKPSMSAHPSVFAEVPRYKTTWIAQHVAVYLNSCAFYSSGVVTFPTKPQFGDATTGTVTCTIPQGMACAGHTYSNCAGVYYKRTAHNNKSVAVNAFGPVDVFTYKWDVPSVTSEYHSPDVAVPVVRPIGETNEFIGWDQGYGKWRVTLVPPPEDSTFDFTGELVQETYLSDNDTCVGPASSPNAIPVVNGPPGNFGDSVGYSACVVEFARATKKTPCGYRIVQRMEINAPSDGNATYAYSTNTLTTNVTGRLIDQNEGQHGIGTVTSQRTTPLSTPRPEPKALATSRIDCLTSVERFKYLFRF